MAKASIGELLDVPAGEHDLAWLETALQWAVELEFATIPVYLSGMWSIKQQSGEAFDLINSVVLEEMLHMGLACNMLTAIGGTPRIAAPSYDGGGLPGGVRPGLDVYLAGINTTTVAMYMQIELPEHPLTELAETFPTIGAFYDAIAAAFTALAPPITTAGQVTTEVSVPDPNQAGQPSPARISEPLGVLATLADVQAAIATIKDQGEGTSLSPDAPQFDDGELAHYYRFGEILHAKKLIEVNGTFQFSGDEVPFPDSYPVARVPPGGYPDVPAIQEFDRAYGQLIEHLHKAWTGGGNDELGQAIQDMFQLQTLAATIVTQPLPDGYGNYGPDFVPASADSGSPAVLH